MSESPDPASKTWLPLFKRLGNRSTPKFKLNKQRNQSNKRERQRVHRALRNVRLLIKLSRQKRFHCSRKEEEGRQRSSIFP